MKFNKILYFLGVTFCFLLVGIMTSKATYVKYADVHSSILGYNNDKELEISSDIIVIGEPVKEFSEYDPTITYNEFGRYNDFYTVTNFKVNKIIKGSNIPKTIPVAQSAAYIKKNLLDK